ncbi:MAG: carboxy-S-adenosyl-L-methionine synthase CmoA [Thioalkalispiraceae bacterium]|jgi:tRNA (cmo5U34)-methyltransferase
MKKKEAGNRDRIYAEPSGMLVDFVFDEKVANVFPDMIRRSVPGYDTIIPVLGVFASKYVQANTNIYDLGCSLGAATLSLRRRILTAGCKIIAIDNAPAMVEQCQTNISQDTSLTPVDVICEDILNVSIENASLVVINFTLQFLPPDARARLLENIYKGLNQGGALILSEKVISEDQHQQDFYDELHGEFKRANGYSELEISQKRTALENVLIPDTPDTNMKRLSEAGFGFVSSWFQCFNFMSFCAVKL